MLPRSIKFALGESYDREGLSTVLNFKRRAAFMALVRIMLTLPYFKLKRLDFMLAIALNAVTRYALNWPIKVVDSNDKRCAWLNFPRRIVLRRYFESPKCFEPSREYLVTLNEIKVGLTLRKRLLLEREQIVFEISKLLLEVILFRHKITAFPEGTTNKIDRLQGRIKAC